jgi:hypothetical protein
MGPLNSGDNFADRGGQFTYSRPGNDDGVTAAVGFLGNTEKFAALVLPKLDMEMLPFDLNVFGFQDIVHFPPRGNAVWAFRRGKGRKF